MAKRRREGFRIPLGDLIPGARSYYATPEEVESILASLSRRERARLEQVLADGNLEGA